jgi:epoxyqueuosine reductase QueG
MFGVDVFGIAPASAWRGGVNAPPELYPAAIWPETRSVIVLAVREQEGAGEVGARLLDEAAYRLAVALCERAYPSVHIPRDCGDANYIEEASTPLFSHELAGALAGLGDIDGGGRLLERAGARRAKLSAVSVLTSYEPERQRRREFLVAEPSTKKTIAEKARSSGAELVGFASRARWEALRAKLAADSIDVRPLGDIHKFTETVIVLGAPLLLPILDACPSIWGLEQEKITSGVLEKSAHGVSSLLNTQGFASARADFSDDELAFAGHCAGFGPIGKNRRLLSRDFGPRVKLIAVAASAKIEDSPEYGATRAGQNPCDYCDYCRRVCPVGAFDGPDGASRCAAYDEELKDNYKNPCGACLKVCPVGADRELYHSHNFEKYFLEKKILLENPSAESYRDWAHVRSYGSKPHRSAEDTPHRGR